MRKIIYYLLPIIFLAACSTSDNGDNGQDAGHDGDGGSQDTGPQACTTDADCVAPDTCQDDGFCKFVEEAKPEDNTSTGTFDLTFSSSTHGEVLVSGKLDGKYLYMDLGGRVFTNSETNKTYLEIIGLQSNQFMNSLVVELPEDFPLDQALNFGPQGVLIGNMDRVEVNENGTEIDRWSIAEVTSGYVAFGAFSRVGGSPVQGTLKVIFRPIW